MLGLYSYVHFHIMLDKGLPRDSELLKHVYPVLTELGLLRVAFGLLALAFAVWSFKGKPRWASVIVLGLAIFSVMQTFVIM